MERHPIDVGFNVRLHDLEIVVPEDVTSASSYEEAEGYTLYLVPGARTCKHCDELLGPATPADTDLCVGCQFDVDAAAQPHDLLDDSPCT